MGVGFVCFYRMREGGGLERMVGLCAILNERGVVKRWLLVFCLEKEGESDYGLWG